jgi:dTDP-4-amino-4,6-dideoxygalactose transaminase
VIDLGHNYRMDDIHASIGLVQLDKIQADLKERAKIRIHYLSLLKDIEGIIVPFAGTNDFSSNYIFTIVLKNSTFEKREFVRGKLAEAGIQTSVDYPAVHRFSIYKEFSCNLPWTNYVADNLITLPMYSKLSGDDIAYITSQLKNNL